MDKLQVTIIGYIIQGIPAKKGGNREQIANYFKIGVYLWDGLNMVKKSLRL